jgi:hypothetical protein
LAALGDEQIDLKVGIGRTFDASEAHTAELFIFGEDNFAEFIGANYVGNAAYADNPAALLRVAEFSDPVGMPGKIPDTNGEADGQGFAGPLLKNFVRGFRRDGVGDQGYLTKSFDWLRVWPRGSAQGTRTEATAEPAASGERAWERKPSSAHRQRQVGECLLVK